MVIKAGCDVCMLAEGLGHADIKMTLQTYVRLWPDRLDEIAKALRDMRGETKQVGHYVLSCLWRIWRGMT